MASAVLTAEMTVTIRPAPGGKRPLAAAIAAATVSEAWIRMPSLKAS
jgi:hypothetical protein